MSEQTSEHRSIQVFVRMKPIGTGGGGGESSTQSRVGVGSTKRILGWGDDAVSMEDLSDGREIPFTFPHAVIGPDATQEEASSCCTDSFLAAFLEGYNVNFMAYGQTGSGKTHTIFGPPGSMGRALEFVKENSEIRPEWGIFPRVALKAFHAMQSRKEKLGVNSVFTGTMVELHHDCILDLLNGKSPCTLDTTHRIQGARHVLLTSPGDIIGLAAAVESRTVNATRMNDSSSRSHCVTTLTLTQYTAVTKEVTVSRFNFVDLAGSERAEEAHDPSKSMKSTASGWEGIVGNWTLMQLARCVKSVWDHQQQQQQSGGQATKKVKKSTKPTHVPFRDCNLTRVLSGSLTGDALTGMVVPLSQAPRNGGQSWLALQFGRSMSLLRSIPKPQQARGMTKMRAEAARKLKENEAALKGLRDGRGGNSKYLAVREGEVGRWQEIIGILDRLVA